jgi:hypothetical protein
MCGSASFNPDYARFERAEEIQKFRSSHLPTDHGHPSVVDPVYLKDMLGDV